MYFLLTEAHLESVMHEDLLSDYERWVDKNPSKEGRLEAIIQQTAAEFRSAIQANGLPLSDESPTALPESCVRHAQSTILFELRKEIGVNLTESENIAAVRADIFLRGIWTGTIPVTADPQSHSPSFQGANQ